MTDFQTFHRCLWFISWILVQSHSVVGLFKSWFLLLILPYVFLATLTSKCAHYGSDPSCFVTLSVGVMEVESERRKV